METLEKFLGLRSLYLFNLMSTLCAMPGVDIKDVHSDTLVMLRSLAESVTKDPLHMNKLVPFDILLSWGEWSKRWVELLQGAATVADVCKRVDKYCKCEDGDGCLSIADKLGAIARLKSEQRADATRPLDARAGTRACDV